MCAYRCWAFLNEIGFFFFFAWYLVSYKHMFPVGEKKKKKKKKVASYPEVRWSMPHTRPVRM